MQQDATTSEAEQDCRGILCQVSAAQAFHGSPTRVLSSTTFVYVKFLTVWALVLLADFILEFRFEYLWPFWLLMRSVYDSFKYQGLVSGGDTCLAPRVSDAGGWPASPLDRPSVSSSS